MDREEVEQPEVTMKPLCIRCNPPFRAYATNRCPVGCGNTDELLFCTKHFVEHLAEHLKILVALPVKSSQTELNHND